MRISLKNFRCHLDAEFTLPREGLIALSGDSGAGKSTILSAIAYAFYGKIPGKVKLPYSHGKKTSTVELELDLLGEESASMRSLKIVRNAKPKSIVVTLDDVEYEGDAAQSIIETELSMNYEEFLAGVYIVQRSNASVLSMTPMEQIQFVELLANHSGPQGVEEFKEKLKASLKECKTAKLKRQGELEGLEVQLEELNAKSPEEVEPPVEIQNGADPDEIRGEISRYELSLAGINKNIQELQRKLNKSRENDRGSADIRNRIQKLQTELGVYERNLAGLGDAPTEEEKREAENAVKFATEELQLYEARSRVRKEAADLDEAIAAHLAAIDEKIEKLKSSEEANANLEELEERVERLAEEAKEYDVRKKIFETQRILKENARKKLAEIFKQIKSDPSFSTGSNASVLATIKTPNKMISFLQNTTKLCLRCPECNAFLLYDEHAKEITSGHEDQVVNKKADARIALDYIKRIEDNGRDLAIVLDDPGPDRPPVDESTKALSKARRIRDELEVLEKRELSSTLVKMQARIQAAARKLGIYDEEQTSVYTDLRSDEHLGLHYTSALEEARNIYDELKRTEESIVAVKAEIEKRKVGVITLRKTLPQVKTDNETVKLEKELSALTQRSGEAHAEITTRRDLLASFAEYESYLDYQKEVLTVQSRIEKCQRRIKQIDLKMEGLYGLEEAGREAEILSLEETVRSINEHARVYLDEMFKDPIVVRLSCVKELKTGKKAAKLQLNTTIDYQGDTYDSIEELSGGERQRCDMAFLLAVNDMIGAKMILLDECLNNLDATINTEVLSMIRDLCGSNKLILVVSHEAVRGVFDSEVFVYSTTMK